MEEIESKTINLEKLGKFKLSSENIHTEENYQKISNLFSMFSFKYLGKAKVYEVPLKWELNEKRRSKNRRMILTERAKRAKKKFDNFKKFVNICKRLNVPFEKYMEFNFRYFKEEFSELFDGKKILTFGFLVSPSAEERFRQCALADEKRLDFFGKVKKEKKVELDIKNSILFSATKFYNRLKYLISHNQEITSDMAIEELKFLYRAKMVSNIYISVSPVVENGQSNDLKTIKLKVKEKLGYEKYKEAMEIHSSLQFENKELMKYV